MSIEAYGGLAQAGQVKAEKNVAQLLGQVCGIVSVGFLFTAFGAAALHTAAGGPLFWACLLGPFLLIFAIKGAEESGSEKLAMGMFYLFAFLEGGMIGPLMQHYLHKPGGAGIVMEAAGLTFLGLLVAALFAFTVSFDYRRFTGIILGGLCALIAISLLSAYFHFMHPSTISWLTLALFALITVVDFARLRSKDDNEGPVGLALSIYLDALNIFLAILQLLGNKDSSSD